MEARRSIGVLAVAATVLVSSCAGEPRPGPRPNFVDDDTIVVGSFNFPESELLAQVYGQALEREGYDVRLDGRLGPRELVEPALARGLVELLPEYSGTAVQFLTLGKTAPTHDRAQTHDALVRALRHERVVALDAAPAQSANAIVVTRATAARFHLRRVSDLRTVAPHMRFGGPPECPTRPFCLQGLARVYGLKFERFVPLDVGGPLTRSALETKGIDVALLFTTDAAVSRDRFVVLDDDRGLQPAESVTPLVRRELVERNGTRFVRTVNDVSRRLTTEVLRELNGRVARGTSINRVARSWLAQAGDA